MLKIYVAHAMTGRPRNTVLGETALAAYYAQVASKYGSVVRLLDPVTAEKVKSGKAPINATPAQIKKFWRRDKEMIREAHVLIDLTGPLKSEGVAHEIGYARFNLWKPVVRVWPGLNANSIAFYEDDLIVQTIEEAINMSVYRWGTWWKRFKWRWSMVNRCFPKWLYFQLREWF